MAEVTVSELAKSVGAPVDRLLKQMQEAGLSQKSPDARVSDDEKQRLLAFLKTSHGESIGEPKKITLQRKTTTTIKTGSGSARKTVNVEVRKKKIYVKRDDEDVQAEEHDEAVADHVIEAVHEPVVEAVPEPVVVPEAPVAAAPEAAAPTPTEAAPAPSHRISFTDGVEEKRRAAIERRQAEEIQRLADVKAREDAKRAPAPQAAKRPADAAGWVEQKPATKDAAAAPAPARPAHNKPKPAGVAAPAVDDAKAGHGHGHKKSHKHDDDADDSNDSRNKRGPGGKTAKKGAAGKKTSKVELLDIVADESEDSDVLARRTHLRASHKKHNKHAFKKPTTKIVHSVDVPETIVVSELASRLTVKVGEIIKRLMKMGVMASMNESIDQDTAVLLVEDMGHQANLVSVDAIEHALEKSLEIDGDTVQRAPVVTVMGHVDHGKTSLLDYVRKANVAGGEAGGITQHIGAYEVKLADGKKITFLDTPGHEAFTAMRARGAKVTDIAVVIVAADDNIMPQTREAISHAQAAGVPIVFAINKIDKPGADPERIKGELAQMNLLVEDWGGKFQSQDISAKKGIGIDELLEKILLESELLDCKANPNKRASGTVLEASLDKGRGYVSKMLVQGGTLRIGDFMVAGENAGRVKAMFNERGKKVLAAGPSTPVLVLGLSGAPQAGEVFKVMADESAAKEIANKRSQIVREQSARATKRISIDEIGRRLALGTFKELNLIIKGDMDGSVEALSDSLLKQSHETVQINVLHKAVGAITEADIMLASASDAIIIGFQVRPSLNAKKMAEREGVEIKLYSIIYEAIGEIRSAIEGMLEPTKEEKITATVEIRAIFKNSKVGTIAGCYVQEGKIERKQFIRVIRDGIVVFPVKEGATATLGSLKRIKDDVKEVRAGFECGLTIDNFNDIQVGDFVESYEIVEVKQKLAAL